MTTLLISASFSNPEIAPEQSDHFLALAAQLELTFMQQKRSAPDYEIGSTGPELIHRVTD
ncbi:MAG: hypothetical protein HZC43_12935 [Nitrosomonadales bacterium]|nr:hypothetical protein [Nitrosomonadales bacterium]